MHWDIELCPVCIINMMFLVCIVDWPDSKNLYSNHGMRQIGKYVCKKAILWKCELFLKEGESHSFPMAENVLWYLGFYIYRCWLKKRSLESKKMK